MCAAKAFLGSGGSKGLRRSMLGHLEDILVRDQVNEKRVRQMKEALQPTFHALPQMTSGKIGASAARYALHRLFVQIHGWKMKGLDRAGDSWDQASPVDALGDRVSPSLRDLLEDRLGKGGLTLHETAVMAATLELMVHKESSFRLRVCYEALGYQQNASLNLPSAIQLTQVYMANHIFGGGEADFTASKVMVTYRAMSENLYPRWSHVKTMLLDTLRQVPGNVDSFDFDTMASVIAVAVDRFGTVMDEQCQELRENLISLEDGVGSGRVRLGDFYNAALNGSAFQFSESVEYLREQGALDDSSSIQRVIIPNYLSAVSNCVGHSGYYAVCCKDPCEQLMDHIEIAVQSPTASPSQLIRLVADLPSAFEPANRSIDAKLRQRLEDVAEQHGGKVPLHGRLFEQWMHYAYPRECPFPHLSGQTNTQIMPLSLLHGKAEIDEMLYHIEQTKVETSDAEDLCSSMWTLEEELVDAAGHKAFSEMNPSLYKWPDLIAGVASILVPLTMVVGFGRRCAGVKTGNVFV